MITGNKRTRALRTALTYLLLILIAVLCAGPFIWLLAASFRTGQNIYDISLIPENPALENYIGVWNFLSVPRYLLNTVIITGVSIAMDVIISALCAYPLACIRFKGRNVILGILLSSMIIPAAAGMIINYLTVSALHLLNTLAGVIAAGAIISVIPVIIVFILCQKNYIEAVSGAIKG